MSAKGVVPEFCMCGRKRSCTFCLIFDYVPRILKEDADQWLAMYNQFLARTGPYPVSGWFRNRGTVSAATRKVEESVKEMFGTWGHYALRAGAEAWTKKDKPAAEPSRILLRRKPKRCSS